MWPIRRGERPWPVFDSPARVTHEWWDADGEHVWCVWGMNLTMFETADPVDLTS
jgi:hypothetical protein